MAWIEMHQSLWTHRKTYAMADELNIDPDLAVAKLARLWCWALDNAPDGNLAAVKPATIARAMNWSGDAGEMIRALIVSGFLEDTEGALHLHDWEDYAGRLIDRRKANAERMREARARGKQAPPPNGASTYKERAANVQDTNGARAGATVPNRTQPNPTVRTSSASEGGLGGETNAADESEESRIAAILEEESAPLKLKAISKTVEQCPNVDVEAIALDYMLWQSSLEPKKRHRNRIQGWQNAVARKHEWPQFQRKPRLSVVPSQEEAIPLPVEPVDCPEVPAWGKLVNHLYGQFQAKRGQAPAEHPRAWTIFGCRPLPADSTNAVLALETHEPPDVAAELAKDVKWWLAGACLGGMRVQVTSRWAS